MVPTFRHQSQKVSSLVSSAQEQKELTYFVPTSNLLSVPDKFVGFGKRIPSGLIEAQGTLGGTVMNFKLSEKTSEWQRNCEDGCAIGGENQQFWTLIAVKAGFSFFE
jgi:hypothetical protein